MADFETQIKESQAQVAEAQAKISAITSRIEEAILRLKKHFSFILVTNNTKQVSRVADRTAFFLYGDLVEIGPTAKIFTAPADRRTNDYLTGRFG